jgi:hypothetical protein
VAWRWIRSRNCPVDSRSACGSSAATTAAACASDNSPVQSQNNRARATSNVPARIAACNAGRRRTVSHARDIKWSALVRVNANAARASSSDHSSKDSIRASGSSGVGERNPTSTSADITTDCAKFACRYAATSTDTVSAAEIPTRSMPSSNAPSEGPGAIAPSPSGIVTLAIATTRT